MASIVQRRRRDGSIGYQVRWRENGRWQSDSFGSQRSAQRFALDVAEAGEQWPEGWVPGYGYAPKVNAREPGETPFDEFATQYLNTRTAVSAYQLTRYRAIVRSLAARFPVVEQVDDQAVASWVRAMLAADAAPKTIANYHGLLYAICAYAGRKGLLEANPCVGTQLPKRSAFDEDGEPIACFLEPCEFALIAEAMCATSAYAWRPAGKRGTRPRKEAEHSGIAFREDRDLISLAVHTGLRWGEVAGLRIGDIDLDRRRLSVKRALKRDGELRWVIGPPKTSRSRRTISLAPALAEMLRPHLADREAAEYVFRNRDGGPLRQNHFYSRRWQPAIALAQRRGLRKSPRFHDLRHTHVAWLIVGNTPLPKIQQRLGHESIQTTIDVYGGLLSDTDDQVDMSVEAMFAATTAIG